MKADTAIFTLLCTLAVPAVAIGGLFHPNTLAGAFARLVFALHS